MPRNKTRGTSVGPDFVALQVRDLEKSAQFYEQRLGLQRSPRHLDDAIVFNTHPIPFAVRKPLPGVDLDVTSPYPGTGVALWIYVPNSQQLFDELEEYGVKVETPFNETPFGTAFSLRDPDGYLLTIHDKK